MAPSTRPSAATFNQTQASLTLSLAASGRADAASNVRRLLDAGVPPNISDAKGFTALACAVRACDYDTCEVLLERGATVNLPTREASNPPLFWSTTGTARHDAILQLLLDRQADASARNVQGDSALHWACKNGAAHAAALLLEAAPPLRTAANALHMTPLMCAAGSGSLDTLQVLLVDRCELTQADLDACDANGRCALHFAGDAPCVVALLDARCDQRVRDADGRTPLLEALQQGNNDVAAALELAWEEEEASADTLARASAQGAAVSKDGSAGGRGPSRTQAGRKKAARARNKVAASGQHDTQQQQQQQEQPAVATTVTAEAAGEDSGENEGEGREAASSAAMAVPKPAAAVATRVVAEACPEQGVGWVRVGPRGKASPAATATAPSPVGPTHRRPVAAPPLPAEGRAAPQVDAASYRAVVLAERTSDTSVDATAHADGADEAAGAIIRADGGRAGERGGPRAGIVATTTHAASTCDPASVGVDGDSTARAWTAFSLRQPSLMRLTWSSARCWVRASVSCR